MPHTLIAGLKPSIFKERRHQLMRGYNKKSALLIAAADPVARNSDAEFPYRQSSDFHYLTGFNEAHALAVLLPGRKQGEFVLFCREFDPQLAVWVGRNAGLEGAREHYGADEAFAYAEIDAILPGLLEGRELIAYPIAKATAADAIVAKSLKVLRERVRQGVSAPWQFRHLDHDLHALRLIKSDEELGLMRQAASISAAAHRSAMQFCRPGLYEYQIEANLHQLCAARGVRAMAYTSIVAGGRNACVLHYTDNNALLNDGDLLLIDAGAEWHNYAADITRTFPVNGRFSEPQRRLYQVVLDAQLAAIDEVRPGRRWNAPHDAAVACLTEGLLALGLLSGSLKTLIRKGDYRRFYMHRTGHWLGMDVHDVGDYRDKGKWRCLAPGMVLTVEPGLYVAADDDRVEDCWRGIGIRIEDDVLVTPEGHEVLSAEAPKTISDIETLMSCSAVEGSHDRL